METNLILELKKQTGASEELCYRLLQTHEWDLTSALVAYMQLYDSKDKCDEASRYNISGSWRMTHDKDQDSSDVVDSAATSSSLICQPKELLVDIEGPSDDTVTSASTKPSLKKTEAVDIIECKKLARGISRATDNENIVDRVRSECALDVAINTNPNIDQFYIETPEYTFTLPDITIYSEEFRKFLEKDLLESSTLVSLEQSGRLNWWSSSGIAKLWPLATSGDGNCLPHAASLGLWGFHDRLLTLRRLLHAALLDAPWKEALKRRWRWTQTRQHTQAGLVLNDEEWAAEWAAVVERAAPAHHSLEEVHVFALAHTLRRPIIVIADVLLRDLNGEAMAPIPFGGVYLPLECSPYDCHKSPLLLAYDMGHFSALVVMENDTFGNNGPIPPSVIPLTDSEGCLLPIQFSVDPGENFEWNKDENDQKTINRLLLSERDQINLLSEYLDVVYMLPSSSPGQEEPDLIDLSEEDITNRFSEVMNAANVQDSDPQLFDSKSKAAKQIHSVAKQFGSIGKSMSNKLKKNLTKMTNKTNGHGKKSGNIPSCSSYRARILCCQLKAKRHAIQDEMVKNYLEYAEHRFLNSEQLKGKQEAEKRHFEALRLREQAILEGPMRCVNGCDDYGTVLTSYMCDGCFQKQKQQETEARSATGTTQRNNFNLDARYGTGRSKFYMESNIESHDAVKRMPSTSVKNNTDQTLYLSKSTFYNDTGKPSLIRANSSCNNKKDWRSTSSDNLINLNPPKKLDGLKRSTLPTKVHTTIDVCAPCWQNTDIEESFPVKDRTLNAFDTFDGPQPCRTPFCMYYGSPLSNYLCSKCCEMANLNQVMKVNKL